MPQDARQIAYETEFSTAYYFLEGLNEIGIEYLFSNLGTDHAPIIEEIAHMKNLGLALPKVLLCPHENTAAHMAGGYAFMTGRGQGVLVHVDVGTANTSNAMHNLFRTRLPVLLMAGKAPYTTGNELVGSRDTYVHFVQEPFDQASLVRPYLKWEWTLPSGVVVKEALRRAHSIMQSDPAGPVYLMMQRETLTQRWHVDKVRSFDAAQYGATSSGQADPELIDMLATRIIDAAYPVLITAYAGRNPRAVRAISELSELAGRIEQSARCERCRVQRRRAQCRRCGAAALQIKRPVANTMMRAAGGGLGWSGGFALEYQPTVLEVDPPKNIAKCKELTAKESILYTPDRFAAGTLPPGRE